MNPEERQDLKRKIEEEIAAQKTLIASLSETSKPVAPETPSTNYPAWRR